MTEKLQLDFDTSALLLMDFQHNVVANFGGDDCAALANAIRLRDAARQHGMMVIFVTVGFRRGYPEVSRSNRIFGAIPDSGGFLVDDDDTQVHARLAPHADEPHVIKRRVGAFTATDLDLILRARDIATLLLSGISTSGVVLSTLRVAADLDYRCVVVADACADGDPEVHACLTEKVFPRQASVMDTGTTLSAF